MLNKKLPLHLTILGVILALIISGCANLPSNSATAAPQPTDTPLAPISKPTSQPTIPPPAPTLESTATPVVVASASTPTTPPETEPTNTPVPEPTDTLPPPLPTPVPQPAELLANGNFEGGFADDGVATGWAGFSNGGAGFAWYDDTWSPVVPEGEHSQLISINDPSLNDRYVGIYQKVDVIPGETYQLSMHGLVRANTPEEQYGHRLYWGVDYEGGDDWQTVEEWVELPWDQQPLVADSFTFNNYTTVITSTGQSLTLFVRGHSKWPRYSEANFNLDGISLWGVPGSETVTGTTMPVTGRSQVNWVPIAALIALVLILFREGWLGITGRHDET